MRSPGGGELSLSACPGVGNRPPSKKKMANPRGVPGGGGMVTGRIEPCITSYSTTEQSELAGKWSGQLVKSMKDSRRIVSATSEPCT